MLFGDSHIWLASSQDGLVWKPIYEPFLSPRKRSFDSCHLEMGPPPIKTEKGWLVIYHGIDSKMKYRLGYLILDPRDPSLIIYRSNDPIFEAEELYELNGIEDILPGGLQMIARLDKFGLENLIRNAGQKGNNPDIIFCCGATVSEGVLRIYYGAADTVIGTATAKLDSLLNF
jgi:beta-1,2-mannobiose phosphorylase / 1,2-beta-oligomannan phosphorylase